MLEADLATLEGVDQLYQRIGGRPVDALIANAGRGQSCAESRGLWQPLGKSSERSAKSGWSNTAPWGRGAPSSWACCLTADLPPPCLTGGVMGNRSRLVRFKIDAHGPPRPRRTLAASCSGRVGQGQRDRSRASQGCADTYGRNLRGTGIAGAGTPPQRLLSSCTAQGRAAARGLSW